MRIHELVEQTAPTVTAQLTALKNQASQQRAAGNEAGARDSERAMAQISTPAAATTTASADPNLLAAVRDVESGGRADAVSRVGAVGAMQTMPRTLKDPGYGVRPAADNSPQELERVGRDYFSMLMKKYGNAETAAVAYNMGPGATNNWIAAGSDISKLPKETQAYVPKVMNRYFDIIGFGTGKSKPTQIAAAAPAKRV
jgi:soluble lytic murein transglycosylase-like protein